MTFQVGKLEGTEKKFKGAVHKRRSQSSGGLSSTDILRKRWSFFRERPLLLVQKLGIFQNLWCVHTAGGGQFFAILCGRLLWTAPNYKPVMKFNIGLWIRKR